MTLTTPDTSSFVVNGRQVSVAADHPHLLAALREELGITSPKDGCSPSGQCGACTVLLDGKAIQACLVNLEKAEGKTVTTLEGFDQEDRDRLAKAFAAADCRRSTRCPSVPLYGIHQDL
jgi:aerobic-type carbon monoxide dehydrogenase small subunit (CoxS/CutS family)